MKKFRFILTLALFFIAQFAHAQTQLIGDGTFDDNTSYWNYYDQAELCNGSNYYSYPDYGIINIYQYNSIDGEIWQYISWPSSVTSATLTFDYYITTDETSYNIAFDNMEIRIVDFGTGNYIVLENLSNLDAHTSYYYLTHTFSSYEIYEISQMSNPCMSFYGTTDASDPTVFRIDNVSLIVYTGSTPIASFTADNTAPCVNSTVNFTDQSLNYPTSWYWDFGDGATSTVENPSHSYANTGSYTVELAVSNSSGSGNDSKSNYITVQNCSAKPIADFTAAPNTTIKVGQYVDFYDNSSNLPTSWAWKFYDGSGGGSGYQTSTDQNPSGIVYATANTNGYTVVLQATNAYGTDTKVKPSYIFVNSYTGIAYNTNASTFSLKTYPNPVSDILNIDFEDNLQEQSFLFQIYDNVGKLILSQNLPAQTSTYQYNAANLPSGLYCVRVITSAGNTITQNIIKK